MENIIYRKSVRALASGSVEVDITDARDGHCFGYEIFTTWFNTNAATERAFIKAHKWADARIELCKKYQT
jgi:hypothetical protein